MADFNIMSNMITALNANTKAVQELIQIFSNKNQFGVPIFESSALPVYKGGASYVITSIDFADPTTWYQNAVQMTGETLPKHGSILNRHTFDVNQDIINGTARKYNSNTWNRLSVADSAMLSIDGGFIVDEISPGVWVPRFRDFYEVRFYDNGVAIPEGDISYISYGKPAYVEFVEEKTGPITADYWYANQTLKGQFIIKPPSNKYWLLERAEINLTKNGTINSGELRLEFWSGTPSPSTLTSHSDWLSQRYSGNFKGATPVASIQDIINQNNGGMILTSPFLNFTKDVAILPLEYATRGAIILNSDNFEYCRIILSDDIDLSGFEICTVTFYLREEDKS